MRNGVHKTRNLRSVWTITTKPYRGAHFAVMASELAEQCIRAGTSEAGCCSQCFTPYKQIVNDNVSSLETTCGHSTTDQRVPSIVLDPFAGAFTTGIVAMKLGRFGVGIELKSEYIELSKKRIEESLSVNLENKNVM